MDRSTGDGAAGAQPDDARPDGSPSERAAPGKAEPDHPESGDPGNAATAGPAAGEPESAESTGAEPASAESGSAESEPAGSESAEPAAAEPQVTEPDSAEPHAGESHAGEPQAGDPDSDGTAASGAAPAEAEVARPERDVVVWESLLGEADQRELDRPPKARPPRRPRSRRRRFAGIAAQGVLGLVSLLVLAATGYAWSSYHTLVTGIVKSEVKLQGPKSVNGDTNILVMGLDSRLDENGDPLPQAIYDQLHAGDSSEGGYNTNVLMLLHVPGDGSRATGISIPRDDYVDLPGKPDGISKGKIKQAYGYAKDQRVQELRAQGMQNKAQLEQQSREAGRQAEIETVRKFLGGITIDHFVEVTLIGFYDIAKAVEPITVCVNEDTKDRYSGANLHQGYQQVDAAQALAFVRQRRDTAYADLKLSDLDRERRQQAFIASVAYQLQQTGTFANPAKLQGLIDAAKKDIVIDSGLDPLAFAQQSSNLTTGNVVFATLPITGFATTSQGEDINVVDVPAVQAMVRKLIGSSTSPSGSLSPSLTPTSAPPVPPGTTVDVVNATYRTGLAGDVANLLTTKGFGQGTATSDRTKLADSTIYYGTGGADGANALAALLGGLPIARDATLGPGRLRLVLGTSFTLPSAVDSSAEPTSGSGSGASLTGGPTSGVAGSSSTGGSASGSSASMAGSSGTEFSPVPTVQGGTVPCVK